MQYMKLNAKMRVYFNNYFWVLLTEFYTGILRGCLFYSHLAELRANFRECERFEPFSCCFVSRFSSLRIFPPVDICLTISLNVDDCAGSEQALVLRAAAQARLLQELFREAPWGWRGTVYVRIYFIPRGFWLRCEHPQNQVLGAHPPPPPPSHLSFSLIIIYRKSAKNPSLGKIRKPVKQFSSRTELTDILSVIYIGTFNEPGEELRNEG